MSSFLRKLRWLTRRPDKEAELRDELRFHLAEEAEERMAAGLPADEARFAAARDFGNVTLIRETARESWRWSAVDRLMQDVRYGYRTLKSTPVVTAVAVLSLALGIGANTAIFSVLDTLLLRSLPVEAPRQLAILGNETGRRPHWTNPIWEQIRDRGELFDDASNDTFDGAFAVSSTRFNLATRGESEFVDGLWASGNTFDVLGVPAMLGRTFTARDDQPGGGPDGPVAVISYGFWQRRFGGAADVIGRSLTVERVPYTIVGVTPPGFFGVDVGRTFDIAAPIGTITLSQGAHALERRTHWWLRIFIRLKPGQSVESGTARLRALQPQIRAGARPTDSRPTQRDSFMSEAFRLEAAATGDSGIRARYRRPLLTLMVVVGLVLLIACANLANLLLARASARRREFSIRIALGASRIRIARQLLTESLLLAGAGALLGVVLAQWSSRLLVRALSTATNTVFLDLSLDWRILGFTAAVALTTAVLFGMAPALRATQVQPNDALKAQGRGTIGDGHGRFGPGPVLIVMQVALSLVLVVAAGLFMRTFSSLAGVQLGFDSRPILVASIEFPAARIDQTRRHELFRQLTAAAAAVPGVSHAALSETTPLSSNIWNNYVELLEGPPHAGDDRLAYFNMVSSGWFETYGTSILAGRDFTRDDTPAAPRVAIVNEAFVRSFNGGRNPIGMRVRAQGQNRLIVGYVRDAVYESLRAPAPPTVYLPYGQETQLPASTTVSVRASGASPTATSTPTLTPTPTRLIRPLAAALGQVNGDLRITFRPLADHVDAALTQERIVAALSAFFGALALLLAGLGLYGITSYAVNRRRTEIAIRMALGAAPAGVVGLVLGRMVILIAIGIIAGAAASLWASRFVSPLLFGLQPRDPLTLAAAIVLLAAIGVLAGWLPARRASRIDPARILGEG
jgi:putative ABC transport system permease protein